VCLDPPKSIGCRDGTRYVQTPSAAEEEKEKERLKKIADRKQKKQERIRLKKEARTPATPADDAAPKGQQQMAVDEEGKMEVAKTLTFPKAPCMKDFLAARTKPPESETIKSADQCLLEVAPKDRAEELARARADVKYLEEALIEANKGIAGSLQLAAAAGLKTKLEQAKTVAESLADKAPASALTITLLEKTISQHKHASTERMQAWKTAAEKKWTNKDNAVKLIDDHITAMQKYRQDVLDDYDTRTKTWEAHNSKVSGVISKVAAALQERLNTANLELGFAATPAEEKKDAAPPAAQVAAPVVEVAAPTQAEQDYYKIAPWSPSELPQIPEAKPGEHEFWLRLAYNVQEWCHTHGCQPCTFGDLVTTGMDPSTETTDILSQRMESLAGLVGLPYWVKMYGDRLVASTDCVPHQLGFVLYQAMTVPRETAEKAIGDKQAKEALKQAKASVKEAMANIKSRPKVGKFVKNSATK
jgi:hypothetical protein